VAEGGEAGAHVVDRDADAEPAQAVQLRAERDVVLDRLVLPSPTAWASRKQRSVGIASSSVRKRPELRHPKN
jgi:hypothetical protein